MQYLIPVRAANAPQRAELQTLALWAPQSAISDAACFLALIRAELLGRAPRLPTIFRHHGEGLLLYEVRWATLRRGHLDAGTVPGYGMGSGRRSRSFVWGKWR